MFGEIVLLNAFEASLFWTYLCLRRVKCMLFLAFAKYSMLTKGRMFYNNNNILCFQTSKYFFLVAGFFQIEFQICWPAMFVLLRLLHAYDNRCGRTHIHIWQLKWVTLIEWTLYFHLIIDMGVQHSQQEVVLTLMLTEIWQALR